MHRDVLLNLQGLEDLKCGVGPLFSKHVLAGGQLVRSS